MIYFLRALFTGLVGGFSLVVNVFTGGNGREFFSARTYRKAMNDGGGWRVLMYMVDFPFKMLPIWFEGTPTHCKDAMRKAEKHADKIKAEAVSLRDRGLL